jgi:oligopeptide/dipeptide ABC transporter ATP-binding protein
MSQGPHPGSIPDAARMKEARPLLEVRNLKTHFTTRSPFFGRSRGVVRAVDGVSLEVRRGETLGLVGESGCGKTTLARSILRLVEPTEGELHFDGEPILKMKGERMRRLRRKCQIIFQDPAASLNPRMEVGAAVDEVLRVHGLGGNARGRKGRVASLLEQVGLHPEHRHRFPHELSGGQRQRIAIARALAAEPELIVCDEPVSALDVSVQAQILNLLVRLQEELELAYLFIAHDLRVVGHLSHRIAVMYLGRIVEEAPAEVLLQEPRHPYTQALLSAAPALTGEEGKRRGSRIVLAGEPPSPVTPPEGCPFHPRCWHPDRDEACGRVVPGLKEDGKARRVSCIKLETTSKDSS